MLHILFSMYNMITIQIKKLTLTSREYIVIQLGENDPLQKGIYTNILQDCKLSGNYSQFYLLEHNV